MKVLVILLFTFLLLLTSGINIRATQSVGVRIEEKGGTTFNGRLDLENNCFVIDDQGKPHEIQGPKAICALQATSRKGGFSLTLEDMSLGLFLKNISGKGGDWVYWVNKTFAPVGLDSYDLKSGDSLVLSNISQDFPEEKQLPSPSPVYRPIVNPAPLRILEKNTPQTEKPPVKIENPKSLETPKTTSKATPIGAPLIAKKEEPKPSPSPSTNPSLHLNSLVPANPSIAQSNTSLSDNQIPQQTDQQINPATEVISETQKQPILVASNSLPKTGPQEWAWLLVGFLIIVGGVLRLKTP